MGNGTLSDRAYQLIKQKIISADYVPGQFLQEAAICADTGLGRTPVHHALHRLRQEGLLEIIARKGILIRTESLSEIFMALEARALVEPYCAAQCAEKASPDQIAHLNHLLERYKELEGQSDQRPLMEIDREFHTAIASIAGNSLLVEFLRPIHERMSRMWFLPHWQMHDYVTTDSEHEKLMDALSRRDGPAASAAMRQHIDSLRRRIMSASA